MFGEGKMPSQPETKIVDQESNKVIILNIDMELIPKMKLDLQNLEFKYSKFQSLEIPNQMMQITTVTSVVR